MDSPFLVEALADLAASLPTPTAVLVADAISRCPFPNLRAEIETRVPHHHHRALALQFVRLWRSGAAEIDGQAVGLALRVAAHAEQRHRGSQSIEVVWTGPDSNDATFRRTEQAILQLLDTAEDRITLVSFAVYQIENVAEALVRAASRGVRLTVIVETPDKIKGEGEYNTIRALGTDVASRCSLYYWPIKKRKCGHNLKPGLLHVKCAVADGKCLFLSSANLTKQAFTINMELGLLIRGGSTPVNVDRLLASMIHKGVLVPVE